MKFDLDTAWKEAAGLLSRNLGLLAIIAGVFFFLPYAGIAIGLPEMGDLEAAQASGNVDAMMAVVTDLYVGYWWVFLILGLVQGIGLLAMLALVRRRANPTVGEALSTGARSVPSYIGAQLLQTGLIVIVATLFVGIGAVTGLQPLAALGGVIAFVVVCYIVVKLSLAAPIIAIEGELNPVKALTRSWALTRGSSMRLLVFYLLLIVAFVVLSAVVSLVLGLVFAFAGEQAAMLGEAVTSGLINAVMIVAMVCVLAAVHTQLSRFANGRAESTED
ncbi:glycerophosphoryl diester phosphodiesterase membrane domain-containing protein [Qipengyuania qiaonensis]|uniref:Glycerophosphoryl diester phosphodiesterase membrane domain-containing protein n=1 Tax=Qipengyuania qiaonensis TaxID=2867240 RepID=A0ABS7J9D1_9SPHN|nr:glycerophosphoryl diester phosphodiesterase membrane domain-containing protein [Qipengyuania qiaonensis]MBX7483861.1 glycerophosphoryl diester phosphodiesterase membrane domain-containing protein [Qipengyuania qiaonensis]